MTESPKERLVARLQEAGLDPERFVQCRQGEKGTHDHTLLSADEVSGVYGVYAGADDPLVWLDIDENPQDLEDRSGFTALLRLPATLEQESPHHSDRRNGKHRAYKVTTDDDRTVAEVLEEEFGKINLAPSWGDVRAKNGYVVGAGSELESCDKEWHDCSEEGEGRYVLSEDQPIAEISAAQLVDALREDPVYAEQETDLSDYDGDQDDIDDIENADILSYALNESNDEKLKRLWSGDYSDYGGDRSRAESALAYKLGFWLRGDKQAVRRAMNGENVPADVSNPRLAKWEERGSSYRESVLEAVDEQTDYFEPAHDPSGDDDSGRAAPDLDEDNSWIDVQALYADSEVQQRHARQAAVSRLLEQHHYATPMDTDHIWVYDDERGIYEPNGVAHIRETLSKMLGPHYDNTEKSEILERVRAQTFIERSDFDAGDKDSLVPVANGVLDLEEQELRDHSPHYYFTRGVEWDYDPDAEAAEIEAFLETVTRREEDKQTLLEMIGAALSPRYEQAKFMIVFGEGSNGKSRFFELVEELLGDDNVAGWDLQDLSQNRFATSNLVGKFANIAPDMPGKKLNEVGTLKKLTGDDVTMAEKKGKDAFELRNTATLMFGANRPPAIPESSRALKRRIVPIRFPKEFTAADDGNPDKVPKDKLMSRLVTEEEMSGLLNLALEGLQRLREQGDVSLPENHDERLEYYEQFSDPIKEFRVNCLENAEKTREKKSAIYDAYTRFCRQNDYDPSDPRVFWKQLRTTTLTVDESKPEIDGERTRVLNGVKFTEPGLEYAPASMLEENVDSGEEEIMVTPVGDLEDHTGETVNVRVAFDFDLENSGYSTDDGPLLRGVASDDTGETDVVSWVENETKGMEGPLTPWPMLESDDVDDVLIRHAYVNEYEGKVQLKLQERTEVTADPGENDMLGHSISEERIETAADGGTAAQDGPPDDAEGRRANAQRIAQTLKAEGVTDSDSAMTPAAISAKVDMDPTTVERALQYGTKKTTPALFQRHDEQYWLLDNWG